LFDDLRFDDACHCAESRAVAAEIIRMRLNTFFILLAIASLVLSGCQASSKLASKSLSQSIAEKKVSAPESVKVEPFENPDGITAEQIVTRYNERNTGSPGWRRVTMQLVTDGNVTRDFSLINLWRSEKGEMRALFLLEVPKGLAGTGYLLREDARLPLQMAIDLYIPADERRVLQLAGSNFGEGLLGSDFSYHDMRMRLSSDGFDYELVGQSKLLGQAVWVVDAKPLTAAAQQTCACVGARYFLARDFAFLMGVDYYKQANETDSQPLAAKQMRVESFAQVDGIWTATRMTMFSSDNRQTTLTLQDAHFSVAGIDPELFLQRSLSLLGDAVQRGWTPDQKMVSLSKRSEN
jgi:hypothetical protein